MYTSPPILDIFLHFPFILAKFIHFPYVCSIYVFFGGGSFTFFDFPLFWSWCIYASCRLMLDTYWVPLPVCVISIRLELIPPSVCDLYKCACCLGLFCRYGLDMVHTKSDKSIVEYVNLGIKCTCFYIATKCPDPTLSVGDILHHCCLLERGHTT